MPRILVPTAKMMAWAMLKLPVIPSFVSALGGGGNTCYLVLLYPTSEGGMRHLYFCLPFMLLWRKFTRLGAWSPDLHYYFKFHSQIGVLVRRRFASHFQNGELQMLFTTRYMLAIHDVKMPINCCWGQLWQTHLNYSKIKYIHCWRSL